MVYRPFFTRISGRNFLPELCGGVHSETSPLQALCCAFALQSRALFEGEKRAKRCLEKGRKGVDSKRGKKEKDA